MSPTARHESALVSVIIIFFDPGPFFLKAIDSVRAQSHEAWELLLVDDGSRDGSSEVARAVAAGDPRIRYLEHAAHANRGMSASRNLGVAHAQGEYIAFLDADDVWLPHKLERQLAILAANPDAAMVIGAPLYWHGWSGQPEDAARDHIPGAGVASGETCAPPALALALYPLGTGAAPCPSDLMIRRTALIEVGGFEESFRGFYEDQAFLTKVYVRHAVHVSGETWTRYRIHPDSCSSRVERAGQYEEWRSIFLDWLSAWLRRQEAVPAAVEARVAEVRQTAHEQEREREDRWFLHAVDGQAALLYPSDMVGVTRVAIIRAASVPHDLQLNRPRLAVRAGGTYSLEFTARADSPRSVVIGVAQGRTPWASAGLRRETLLGSEWQSFRLVFTALFDEDDARIHVDLGGSSTSVELRGTRLVDTTTGNAVTSTFTRDVDTGSLRTLAPASRVWGFDRGRPVDRYYVERFLEANAACIRGHVLEVGDDTYARAFGGTRVTGVDILHVEDGAPRATMIADLSDGAHLESAQFDCVVLTQVLHLIYDTPAALATVHRILRPGGVVLATMPGLTRTSTTEWPGSWYWGFTRASAQRLFMGAFPGGDIQVQAHGNVLTATAFLHGLATEDLRRAELDHHDPEYELLVAVRAVKAGED